MDMSSLASALPQRTSQREIHAARDRTDGHRRADLPNDTDDDDSDQPVASNQSPPDSPPPSAFQSSPPDIPLPLHGLQFSSPGSSGFRSASRGRDGYGFRPSSGPSTPVPSGLEGINIQPGTAAVVDQNGLGWPGEYIPLASLSCLL